MFYLGLIVFSTHVKEEKNRKIYLIFIWKIALEMSYMEQREKEVI